MKKILLALGLWFGAATGVFAQGVLPVALQQQVDINGHPLPGALLFTFVQGTVAQQQNTFADSGLTVQNPWPLAADQSGRIPMFYMAAGSTHARMTDASGNVLFDVQNMLVIGAAGGGGGGGGAVDPTTVMATGDLKVRYGTGSLSGFVRANGLTIGSATSGASERANSDTQNLFVYLYGTDPNLAVSGGRTGNALNDFNANKTIALPDWRGYGIAALGDMGNTPTSVLTSSFAGCTPTTLGTACGNQSSSLITANLPPYTPGGSVTMNAFSLSIPVRNFATSGSSVNEFSLGSNIAADAGAINVTNGSPNGNAGFTSSLSFSGLGQGGSSSSFGNVSPEKLATIYLKL